MQLCFHVRMKIPSHTLMFLLLGIGFLPFIYAIEAPNITFLNASTNQITVEWSDVNASTYRVVIVSSDKDIPSALGATSFLEFEGTYFNESDGTPITPNTEYNVVVYARNSSGDEELASEKITTIPDPATNVRLTHDDISTSQLTVEWDAPNLGGAYSYNVTIDKSGGDTESDVVSNSSTSKVFTGLEAGRIYTASVQTLNKDGNPGAIAYLTGTAGTNPEAPTLQQASNLTTTESITLTWTEPPSGAWDNYKLYFNGSGAPVSLFKNAANQTIGGLSPNTVYTFELTSVSESGLESAKSNTVDVATLPDPVTNIVLSGTSASELIVSWKAPSNGGAHSYVINVFNSNDATEFHFNNTVHPALNVTFTRLVAGATYNASVRALNRDSRPGEIAYPTIVGGTNPETPGDLRVSGDITTNSSTLTWNAPSSGSWVMYKLYQNGTIIPSANLGPSENETTVMALTSNTDYTFELVAFSDLNLTSAKSNPVLITTDPEPVTNVRITQNSANKSHSIDVAWDEPVNGADHYIVVLHNSSIFRNVTETSVSLGDLTPGKTYSATVVAYNKIGGRSTETDSEESNGTDPLPPTDLAIEAFTSIESDSIPLVWTLPEGKFASYKLYIDSEYRNDTFPNLTSNSTTNVVVTGLTPNQEHEFQLTTVSHFGYESVKSNSARNTTRSEAVSSIEVSRNPSNETHSFVVSWSSPSTGAHSYSVSLFVATNWSDHKSSFTNGTEITFSDLVPGTTYNASVVTLNKDSLPSTAVTYAEKLNGTRPMPPTNLHATTMSYSTVNLAWENPIEGVFESFILSSTGVVNYHRTDPALNRSDISATRVLMLDANTNYGFKLRTVSDFGIYSDQASAPPVLTLPNKPGNVTLTRAPTPTELYIMWTQDSSNTTYQVRVWVRADGIDTAISQQNITSFETTVRDLIPGQLYHAEVTGVNAAGRGVSGIATPMRTEPQMPTLHPNPSATANTITLAWTFSKETQFVHSGYDLYINNTLYTDTTPSLTSFTGTQVTVNGLQSNKEYNFTLVAVSGPTYVAKSQGTEVRSYTVPDPPTDVQIALNSTDNTTNIIVNFSSPVNGADSYQASISGVGDEGGENISGDTSPLTFDTLKPGSTYAISIMSKNRKGYSVPTALQFITTAPLAVDSLVPTSHDEYTIQVSWSLPVVPTTRDSLKLTYFVFGSGANSTEKMLPYNETTASISELIPGQTYVVLVTAVSNNTESKPVAIVERTDPLPVRNIRLVRSQNDSLEIEWDPPSDDSAYTRYRVQYGEQTVFFWETVYTDLFVEKNQTSARIELLKSGTFYLINVSTESNSSEGDNPATATYSGSDEIVKTTYPNPVRKLVVTQNSENPFRELHVSWESNGNVERLEIRYWEKDIEGAEVQNAPVSDTSNGTTIHESIEPGTNYVIIVYAISGELNATTEGTGNTKPAVPTNLKHTKISQSSFTVEWTKPEGNVREYEFSVKNHTEKSYSTVRYLKASQLQYTVQQLWPYYTYDVLLKTYITNHLGENETSDAVNISVLTSAAAPYMSLPVIQEPVFTATMDTISIQLSASIFQDIKGPISHLFLKVSTESDPNFIPDNMKNETWDKYNSGGTYEWVAEWKPFVPVPKTNRTKRSLDNPQSNREETFVVGDETVSMSPWGVNFTNGKLRPSTGYKFAFGAVSDKQVIVQRWTRIIHTGKSNRESGKNFFTTCSRGERMALNGPGQLSFVDPACRCFFRVKLT